LPAGLAWYAVLGLVAFFWIATCTYLYLGIINRTDNQFSQRNFKTTAGMYLLII
jgi:hypothetical protein